MTFTYSSTDTIVNRVRLLISDTDTSNPLFSDEEINLFLSIYGNDEHYIAAACCRAIAANKGLQAITFNLHMYDVYIDKKEIPKHFLALANMYEKTASNITVKEYFDSVDYEVDQWGRIQAEFIGDEEIF